MLCVRKFISKHLIFKETLHIHRLITKQALTGIPDLSEKGHGDNGFSLKTGLY